MAAAPRPRTGPSRDSTLAAAITIQLENLLKALEATEKAIAEKMKEMGMAPFTGPILQAWRKDVAKTFTKESKRMAKAFEQIVEKEATRTDPVLKIQEAEAQLAKVTKQLEEAQRLSENVPTAQPQIVEDAENRAMLTELQEKAENLTVQLQAREEELNRLYNLTENDPKYQAYHVVRDLAPNWVDIKHVGRSLGMPAVRAKRLLEEFEANGLVEIDGDRVRALQLIRKADTTRTKE